MTRALLNFYRFLPAFKGKLRIGRTLFASFINKNEVIEFKAHQQITYKLPNTIESLGVVLLITGIYEQKVIRFLQRNINPDSVYFDIGANIGSLGLPVVKVKPGAHYYGFEASPVVFEYLQYNFRHNNIKNYQLFNNLVHEDSDRELKFYQSENYGKSSMSPMYSPHHILVRSVSIDLFCKEHNLACINWMKVDVQGFELYVFKGMKELLRNRQIENILFEFEYWAEEDAGLEKGAAQKYLSESGYDLFDLDGKKLDSVITSGRAMVWAKPSVNSVGIR